MREIAASEAAPARAAIEYFAYRAACEIGSLAAAAGGLDALVFTGGVGANDASIRELICVRCDWLGLAIDASSNAKGSRIVSTPDSRIEVVVLPTNEELQIARETNHLVNELNPEPGQ
jgi:acetate kinase